RPAGRRLPRPPRPSRTGRIARCVSAARPRSEGRAATARPARLVVGRRSRGSRRVCADTWWPGRRNAAPGSPTGRRGGSPGHAPLHSRRGPSPDPGSWPGYSRPPPLTGSRGSSRVWSSPSRPALPGCELLPASRWAKDPPSSVRKPRADSPLPGPRRGRIAARGQLCEHRIELDGIHRFGEAAYVGGIEPAMLGHAVFLDVGEARHVHRQVRCVSNEEVLDRVVRLAEERKGHPTYRHEPAPFDVVLAGLLPQLPPGRLLDRLIRLDAATGREPPGAIERDRKSTRLNSSHV